MKKTLLIIIYGLLTACVADAQSAPLNNASNSVSQKEDILQLKETGFSFGKIPQGRPVNHVFEVVN
ncbi:MAG: DUF1573 domain-containing protein, partial [Bacteroidota bacterium]|nr:DUF1573 domain-containing protein [Bacteroidota bacterium]